MRVNIGTYTGDLINIRRWQINYFIWRHDKDEYFVESANYDILDKIVVKLCDIGYALAGPINRWSNRRPRKQDVRIDEFDVWNADHTLSLIIHPVLIELKRQLCGAASVSDDDVPDNLKSSSAPPKQNDYDTDDNHFLRWEYVLDEMIWTFGQCIRDDHGCVQFQHNIDQLDVIFTPADDDAPGASELSFNHQKDPTKPKYWLDRDGQKLHMERIRNGHRLFGKYYLSLWN